MRASAAAEMRATKSAAACALPIILSSVTYDDQEG